MEDLTCGQYPGGSKLTRVQDDWEAIQFLGNDLLKLIHDQVSFLAQGTSRCGLSDSTRIVVV